MDTPPTTNRTYGSMNRVIPSLPSQSPFPLLLSKHPKPSLSLSSSPSPSSLSPSPPSPPSTVPHLAHPTPALNPYHMSSGPTRSISKPHSHPPPPLPTSAAPLPISIHRNQPGPMSLKDMETEVYTIPSSHQSTPDSPSIQPRSESLPHLEGKRSSRARPHPTAFQSTHPLVLDGQKTLISSSSSSSTISKPISRVSSMSSLPLSQPSSPSLPPTKSLWDGVKPFSTLIRESSQPFSTPSFSVSSRSLGTTFMDTASPVFNGTSTLGPTSTESSQSIRGLNFNSSSQKPSSLKANAFMNSTNSNSNSNTNSKVKDWKEISNSSSSPSPFTLSRGGDRVDSQRSHRSSNERSEKAFGSHRGSTVNTTFCKSSLGKWQTKLFFIFFHGEEFSKEPFTDRLILSFNLFPRLPFFFLIFSILSEEKSGRSSFYVYKSSKGLV